jgi:hypothetical protein
MLILASGIGSIRVGIGLFDSSGWLTITGLLDGIPLGALLPPPVSWFTLETACLMASDVSYSCYLLE